MSETEIELTFDDAERFEIPDGKELCDYSKARGFTERIIGEAQADGLNLLELMSACEWVRASCAAMIRKNLAAAVSDDDVRDSIGGLEDEPGDEPDGEDTETDSAPDDVEGHEQP